MNCHFCNTELDEDNRCFGCGKFVCDECDVNYDMPFGAHDVEEHAQEPG